MATMTKEAEREAQGEQRRGREPKPIVDTPQDKAQTNFTDPDAKIMKTSNKGQKQNDRQKQRARARSLIPGQTPSKNKPGIAGSVMRKTA